MRNAHSHRQCVAVGIRHRRDRITLQQNRAVLGDRLGAAHVLNHGRIVLLESERVRRVAGIASFIRRRRREVVGRAAGQGDTVNMPIARSVGGRRSDNAETVVQRHRAVGFGGPSDIDRGGIVDRGRRRRDHWRRWQCRVDDGGYRACIDRVAVRIGCHRGKGVRAIRKRGGREAPGAGTVDCRGAQVGRAIQYLYRDYAGTDRA